jgi:ferredoxin
MAKPVVDTNICIGCGACAGTCPEVFELKNDISVVVGPDKCATCDCEAAVSGCPVQAISMQ